jgi:hypothetical protein
MHWIKHITVPLLVLAAFAVAVATVFSDHAADYGTISLPQGGLVELPSGTVKVFYEEGGDARAPTARLSAPLSFEVTPAGGGAPLEETPTAKEGTAELETQRSTDVGSPGSVADIEVPAEGSYLVSGSSGQPAGASALTFGTDPLGAVIRRWKLLAGLLIAAVLVALVPLPRRRSHDEAAGPSGWSSDPSTPYARSQSRAPYAG